MGETEPDDDASIEYAQIPVDEELRDDLRKEKRDGETWTAYLERLRSSTEHTPKATIEIGDDELDEIRDLVDERVSALTDELLDEVSDEVENVLADALDDVLDDVSIDADVDADVDTYALAENVADEVEERLRK